MGCGERAFRFRPNLIFGPAHATEAAAVIDSVLSKGL
jgi:hypothetical protein